MPKIKRDYIVVGQGLAGSWLAYELLAQGYSITVVDREIAETSSLRAAGIYNPITGRKMVKTWRADDLFPSLENAYRELERTLGSTFLHPTPIYRPFTSIESQNDWAGKAADRGYSTFIRELKTESLGYSHVHDPLGGIVLNFSGYVDLSQMLGAVKVFLQSKGAYWSHSFEYDKLRINENDVQYGDLQASKIIFCEGSLSKNPFWELPFRPVRGEIIDIETDLQSDYILNQGVFMIPKKGKFTVGSTYDHENLGYEPQERGIKSIKERLAHLYTGTYRIINQRAGVRPATHDRRPYIGFHHKHKTLAIFNGFGTKGVSLIPYFAKKFLRVLQNETELDKEVDVQRVF